MQNSYSAIFMMLCLYGCGSIKPIHQMNTCDISYENIDKRILVTAAKTNTKEVINCIKNFKNFNPEVTQIKTCHTLKVNRKGRVQKANTRSIASVATNDLNMCLTQAMWRMNFKSLDLSSSQSIKYNYNFSFK